MQACGVADEAIVVQRNGWSPGRTLAAAGLAAATALALAPSAVGPGTAPRTSPAVVPAAVLHLAGGGVAAQLSASAVSLSAPAGTLTLALAASGRDGHMRAARPAAVTPAGRRVRYVRPGLTEWYASRADGIEQGFAVGRRPSGGGPLVLALRLRGPLSATLAGDEVRFAATTGAVALRYGRLAAFDARGRRLTAALALRGRTLGLRVDDRGARYPLRVDPLVAQGAKITPSDETGHGNFGAAGALSADGTTALIGAPWDHGVAPFGAAWAFTRSGGLWTQQDTTKLLPSFISGQGNFGGAVALSSDGNTGLIGAPRDSGQGYVSAFVRSGTTWASTQRFTPSDVLAGDEFGDAIAISADGTTAMIVGISGAWAFTRSGNTWVQQGARLAPNNTVPAGSGFGGQVALSADGNTAMISGPGDTPSGPEGGSVGAVWVFTRAAGTWSQGQKLIPAGETGDVEFGSALAMSSDATSALIGSSFDNNDQGAVWAYTQSGGTWTQQPPKLTPQQEGYGAVEFGTPLALSADGNTALISARTPPANGEVGVYHRVGGVWTPELPKLASPSPSFGVLALSSDASTALVSDFGDSSGNGAAFAYSLTAPAPPVPIITSPTPPAPPPPPTPSAPPHAPVLTHLSQLRTSWAVTKGRGKHPPPVGTSFSVTLDQAAKVHLTITGTATGRRVSSKCVAKTQTNAHKPSCTRSVAEGTLTVSAGAGKTTIAFKGKVGSKTLRPGHYKVAITATSGTGRTSTPRTLSFTVVT